MDESLQRAKDLRKQLKIQWSDLWINKYGDKRIAEDVSLKEYNMLFVDRGEIVQATRDYKPLSFQDIYERHVGVETASKAVVEPEVGGWKKFARTHFSKDKSENTRERPKIKVDLNQHQRKNGSGWLNQARIRKRIKENTF